MATVWFSTKQSGNIDIEIKTYSGGTMIQSGFNINSGGALIQTVNFSKSTIYKRINFECSKRWICKFHKSSSTGLITIYT
jgi:hypothetical protein